MADEKAVSPRSPKSPRASKSHTSSPKAASPAALGPDPASPPAVEGLQPPEHWLEQPFDDEDEDDDSAIGEDTESSTASLSSSILKYRTVNGRTYHSERGDNIYWGPNDTMQNNTLDIIHHALTLMCEDKLYFAPLNNVNKVLDIGTGTGLWAIDFGDEHPETEVIGTDLSPIQPLWVPPNVRFMIDDYKESWTFQPESFDYIHLRWLVGTVDNWEDLFRQAFLALKPGGWVESLDCDGGLECDDGTMPDSTAAAQWSYIFREGARKAGVRASFSVVSDGLQRKGMEAAGFVAIQERPLRMPISEWSSDPRAREVGLFTRAGVENDTDGIFGFMAAQLGWSPEAIHVYGAHLRREMRSLKVHSYIPFHNVIAQKPM